MYNSIQQYTTIFVFFFCGVANGSPPPGLSQLCRNTRASSGPGAGMFRTLGKSRPVASLRRPGVRRSPPVGPKSQSHSLGSPRHVSLHGPSQRAFHTPHEVDRRVVSWSVLIVKDTRQAPHGDARGFQNVHVRKGEGSIQIFMCGLTGNP